METIKKVVVVVMAKKHRASIYIYRTGKKKKRYQKVMFPVTMLQKMQKKH